MAVTIPDTVQLRLRWTFAGARDFYNVLHLGNGTGAPVTDSLADDVAGEVALAHINSGIRPFQQTNVTLADIALRDLSDEFEPEHVAEVASSGSSSGERLPVQNAVVVTLRTPLAGRSFRGRCYLGGFVEGSNTSAGRIISTLRTASVEFLTRISNGVNANTALGGLVIASRVRQESIAVTSIVSRDDVWDTQRRRGRPLS